MDPKHSVVKGLCVMERSGSEVECLTRDRGGAGVTALCP